MKKGILIGGLVLSAIMVLSILPMVLADREVTVCHVWPNSGTGRVCWITQNYLGPTYHTCITGEGGCPTGDPDFEGTHAACCQFCANLQEETVKIGDHFREGEFTCCDIA